VTPEQLAAILAANPDLRRENVGALALPPASTRLRAATEACAAPTEEQEQAAVIAWAAANEHRWPELAYLAHVPNGGARDAATGAMLKRAGVRAGFPDLILCTQRGGYGALFIEMKRADRSNHPTPEQGRWLDFLAYEGYAVAVCYGAQEAIGVITRYLEALP
jgi:hypothetical protein